MINPATESFGQARQGSVAAIIQVLNERLSDSGIRTRAVVADGTLQLLCEAATPEQLDQSTVVERVRSELETISPQRIKKVKINSRIAREAQLLWLEEINRNPEKALLWSEVITLKRPFFVKRWIRDRHLKPAGPIFKDISQPEPSSSLLSKLVGGTGLLLLLLVAGWLFRNDLGRLQQAGSTVPINAAETEDSAPAITDTAITEPATSSAPKTSAPKTRSNDPLQQSQGQRAANTTPPAAPANQITASNRSPTGTSSNASSVADDAFAAAVRIAEQASVDGQSAKTAAEWLDLAARWQKASDLMGNIPKGDEQYAIAQDRIKTYQANSQSALQQANAAKAQ